MTGHVIIWNPASGAGKRRKVDQLAHSLTAVGCPNRITETTGPGDATRLAASAAREGASAVIAAGGDGTIREVATGLVGSHVPLGLFPVGTANSLARELGMPPRLSAEAMAGIIAAGHTMPLYPGYVMADGKQELFLESASAGLDSRAVDAVTKDLKRRFGPLAYVLTALRRFVDDPHEDLSIEIINADGAGVPESIPATWAMAVRTDHFGGWFRVGSGVAPDESRLVIIYIKATKRFDYVRCLIGLLRGQMADVRGVGRIEVVGEVELLSPGSVPLQLDGDIVARTPVSIGVLETPIGVIVPPGRLPAITK